MVASLQVGMPREIEDTRKRKATRGPARWHSGLWKEPVGGRRRLRRTNFDGDGQGDTNAHGGPDKAVCVYPLAHYPLWRTELGIAELAPGAFGENLTVEAAAESTTCVGDVYRLGDALVQVSQPRAPCWKIANRWDVEDLVVRVRDTDRTGWYLRVLEEGHVGAGDTFELVERPHPEWTITTVNTLRHHRQDDLDATARLVAVGPLAARWRGVLERRLEERAAAGS